MAVFRLAYTEPINPAGSSPVLTWSQVWAGFQRKLKNGHEFVPSIQSCEIVSEDSTENTVTRDVIFKAGQGPKGGGATVKEFCKSYEPVRVDFRQEDGSSITNLISSGSGGAEDLYMTFAFEWRHADVEDGSEEAKRLEGAHQKVSQRRLSTTISLIAPIRRAGISKDRY